MPDRHIWWTMHDGRPVTKAHHDHIFNNDMFMIYMFGNTPLTQILWVTKQTILKYFAYIFKIVLSVDYMILIVFYTWIIIFESFYFKCFFVHRLMHTVFRISTSTWYGKLIWPYCGLYIIHVIFLILIVPFF